MYQYICIDDMIESIQNNSCAGRLLYHEAPDEIFELFVLLCSEILEDGRGQGGMNFLRLVSKRCMGLVESLATRLTNEEVDDGPSLLPFAALKRCKGIEHVNCDGLMSLEGCPDGLKSLYIRDGRGIKSLEPLSACQELTLEIHDAHRISDLSPLSSMLSSCTKLRKLVLTWSKVTDLSPLYQHCRC